MNHLFQELRRRRVYQAAAIYAVAAWGLAQVVDFVAERLFLPDWVPTITAIVFVVGFPVAIFLAWVFDIGPDGIRRTETRSIRGLASLTAALVLLIGGTVLIYSIVWPSRDAATVAESQAPVNSIAVLPFSVQGDDARIFLGDGVAEEILYALNSLPDLRVAARTSSFSFEGNSTPISEISSALNVRHVLEGRIKFSENVLRIDVNLVRADTGFSIWSESYDRDAADILSVQTDIASKIASAVRSEVGDSSVAGMPRFRSNTGDPDAYSLYLQGRHLWHQRGSDNIRSAIAFFEQAIDKDPEFAAAWAGLASAFLTSGTYGSDIEDPVTKAADAARQAIELDNQLGEPYGSLAQVEFNAQRYAAGEDFLKQGLVIEPRNSTLRLWYAVHLIEFGRAVEAMTQIGPVIERDPAYPVLRANFGFSNFINGDLQVAKSNLDAAWNMGLRPLFMWRAKQYVNLARADFDAAELWIESMPVSDPETFEDEVNLERAWIDAMRRSNVADHDKLVRLATEMASRWRMDPGHVVVMLAAVGENDLSLDILIERANERAYVDRGTLWIPLTAELRSNPRFSELAALLELPLYWSEVAWPDACGPDERLAVRCFR